MPSLFDLKKCLREEIANQGGMISFADFMNHALYHPQGGYYASDSFALGKAGDFVTAPELSPLFATCVANAMAAIPFATILELGAGTGRFAADVFLALTELKRQPHSYLIYEISPTLRAKQQAYLAERLPQFFHQFKWLEDLPPTFEGIIFANEVLDALPVHRFTIEQQTIKEKAVAVENDQFIWISRDPSEDFLQVVRERVLQNFLSADTTLHPCRYMLRDAAKSAAPQHERGLDSAHAEERRFLPRLEACSGRGEILPEGYTSEIHLTLTQYVRQITKALSRGVIFFIDYGYGREEYYHPERSNGTLTCFHQHQRHDDPLAHPGEHDITAHVDFTTVVEEAVENGCSLAGFTSQAAFLLDCGLLDLATALEKKMTDIDAFNLHQAIKLLTLPTEMGERVKVMALTKQLDTPILGFTLLDKRREL